MKTFKLLAVVQILAITFFSACTLKAPTTVCHATEDPANPYEAITVVDIDGLKEHRGHPYDISPIPVGGCPTVLLDVTEGKVTICHATISKTNPYREITVSVYGLAGHGMHEADIFPVPERGCPTGSLDVMDGKITICHATGSETNPYDEITISLNALTGHDMHEDDIIPAPENGCPTIPLVITDGKITICHATSSERNPYREITVSVYGLAGHGGHEEDIFPVPEDGCPDTRLDISDEGKITICHNTGSEKNPYVEITISLNGLNGHGAHENDIIPAPESGCPTEQP